MKKLTNQISFTIPWVFEKWMFTWGKKLFQIISRSTCGTHRMTSDILQGWYKDDQKLYLQVKVELMVHIQVWWPNPWKNSPTKFPLPFLEFSKSGCLHGVKNFFKSYRDQLAEHIEWLRTFFKDDIKTIRNFIYELKWNWWCTFKIGDQIHEKTQQPNFHYHPLSFRKVDVYME